MEAKATYHLPPNFSTPPPPDGPFHLGTVLREFEQKEQMRPLNKKISQRVEIPEKHEDAKAGFTATRKMMKAGECGVWAKFMGLNGVGGEASIGAERHDSDSYSFKSFETHFFYPNDEYISDCLKLPGVDDYLQGSRYKKAIYLVTGLKIGRGMIVGMDKKSSMNGNLEASVSNPGGTNVDVGFRLGGSRENGTSFTFTGSSDIVIGIQCIKIYHEKSGLLGLCGEREIKSQYVTAGATFFGEDFSNSSDKFVNFTVVRPEDYDMQGSACYYEGDEVWMVPEIPGA